MKRQARHLARLIDDVLRRRISFSLERRARFRVRIQECHIVESDLEAWFAIPTRLPRRVFVTDLMDPAVTQEIEVLCRRPVRVAALADGTYCYVISLRPVIPWAEVLRPPPRRPGRLVFGRDAFGRWVSAGTEIGHLLVAGMTGSGKSVALHHLLFHLADSVELCLIDPKRVELPRWASHARATAWSAEDALDLLRQIHNDVDLRNQMFSAQGCRGIRDWNARNPQQRVREVVVVVEEAPALLMAERIGKQIGSELAWLAAVARSAGYCIIIAAQQVRRDVFPRALLMNLEHRMVFRVADKIESNLLLGATGIYATALDTGHALLRLRSATIQIQVPLLSDLD